MGALPRAALTVPSRELRKTGSSRAVTRGWVVSRVAWRNRPAPALQSPLPLVALRLRLVPAAGADPSGSRCAHLQGGLGAAAFLGQAGPCQPASPEQNDALEEPSLSAFLKVGATWRSVCLCNRRACSPTRFEDGTFVLNACRSLEPGKVLWKRPLPCRLQASGTGWCRWLRNAPADAFAIKQRAAKRKTRSVRL